MDRLQADCYNWVVRVMDHGEVYDVRSRATRFTEEAIELAQAATLPKEDVLRLVEYVYSKPAGDCAQEVGGVTLTLAALCNALKICWSVAAWKENDRCWHPAVRAKIHAKWRRIKEHKQEPGEPPI